MVSVATGAPRQRRRDGDRHPTQLASHVSIQPFFIRGVASSCSGYRHSDRYRPRPLVQPTCHRWPRDRPPTHGRFAGARRRRADVSSADNRTACPGASNSRPGARRWRCSPATARSLHRAVLRSRSQPTLGARSHTMPSSNLHSPSPLPGGSPTDPELPSALTLLLSSAASTTRGEDSSGARPVGRRCPPPKHCASRARSTSNDSELQALAESPGQEPR